MERYPLNSLTTSPLQGIRILVAEDNPVNQKLMRAILGQLNCVVTVVPNGLVALEEATKGVFDVILMDCQMPVMDGYQAAQRLRSDKVETPIIAITAHAMAGEREKCLSVGINEYLTKPINFEELKAALLRWTQPVRGTEKISETKLSTPTSSSALKTLNFTTFERIRILGESSNEKDLPDILIGVYLESASCLVEELQDASRKGNTEVLLRTAHSLKSSSGSLGAERLAALCAVVEAGARLGDPTTAVTVESIAREWCEVSTQLAGIQGTSAHYETPPTLALDAPLVLIVDDDPNLRLLSRRVLTHAGMRVTEVENGTQALTLLQKTVPDLVVLDVVMPGIDGFETCVALRKLPGGKRVPVLMLTGVDDATAVERAYQVGATDFLPKHDHWALLAHRARYLLRSGKILEALHESEERLRTLSVAIEQSPTAILITDCTGKVEYVNPSFCQMTGYSQREILGQSTRLLKSGETIPALYHDLWDNILGGKVWRGEMKNRRKDGNPYWISLLISPIYALNKSEGITHFLSIQEDITDKRNQEERIRSLSYFDTLTGLPNRRLFRERLEQVILEVKTNGQSLVLLHFGLDHFKRINDTLGPQAGDLLLQHVAARFVGLLRKTPNLVRFDEEGSLAVARVGGDEFSIMLLGSNPGESVDFVVHRLLKRISYPFEIDKHEIVLSLSIGIAFYPLDGENSDALLKSADIALYNAKEGGKNTYRFYSHTMNEAGMRRMQLEEKLRRALERRELFVYYQPQLDLRTGRVTGCEALIRWIHPEMGMVSPVEFIPIAEENGLIGPIGAWVLKEACQTATTWPAPLRVAVNLSARQFRHQELRETITRALESSGLSQDRLELEITESVIMQDAAATIRLLQELNAQGLHLAVDDFGTGYSSLSYLKAFPIDTLKIDRSFVMDVATSKESAHIVTAIIAMGHGLGLKIVAEGVEDEPQMQFLREQGCDFVQGYLFSRPLPPNALLEFFEQNNV
ncbi:diguanylate cyclase [Gammaproteobacteria bacterium]